jgi:hypothetical protein
MYVAFGGATHYIILISLLVLRAISSAHPIFVVQCLTWSLLRNANDTASRTRASIASLLALLVSALAQIISTAMHDNGTSQHALRANQLDQLVCDGALGVALAIGLEVAQVSHMAVVVGWGAVLLAVWVDCGRCLSADATGYEVKLLTVWTSAGAAIGVVAEGVDVHAALG